jgi:hypothetical protein
MSATLRHMDPQSRTVASFASWLAYMGQSGFVVAVSIDTRGAAVTTDHGVHHFTFKD